jgi:hypothetical protein
MIGRRLTLLALSAALLAWPGTLRPAPARAMEHGKMSGMGGMRGDPMMDRMMTGMSAAEKQHLRTHMMNMRPAQRKKMMDRMMRMTAAQRRRKVQQMMKGGPSGGMMHDHGMMQHGTSKSKTQATGKSHAGPKKTAPKKRATKAGKMTGHDKEHSGHGE